MSNENEDKKVKQQQEQEASKKVLTTGAKAAANAYAGPLGGKAVDLASKTKLGNDILNTGAKVLNNSNPGLGKVANVANKIGALDAADKAVDVTSGSVSSKIPNGNSLNSATNNNVEIPVEDNAEEKKSSLSNLFGDNKIGGIFSSFANREKKTSGDEKSVSSKMFEFIKKNKLKFLSILGGIVLFFIVLLLLIIVIFGFSQGVVNFFNGIADFFTMDQQEAENDYYEALQDVQKDINTDYQVCIDVNLITAALMVNVEVDDMLESGEEIVDDEVENPDYDLDSEDPDNTENQTSVEQYKKMKKQIRILANMQLVTKNYELDNSDGSYCAETEQEILIREGSKDSSTPELIAKHDKNGFLALFTSKSYDEQNNAYYIFKPEYDEDGDCSYLYAKGLLPKKEKILSIGDLSSYEDSVFYWNLVNSFIPSYYEEYLPNSEPARTEAIKKIADDIYLLYNDMGPSQTCSVSYAGPSSLCPNGITVGGESTMDLEEYVAGVVSREAYVSEGIEALKAQAVAARTYALKYTNYCQSSIDNNTNAQTFTRDINDRAREATNATRGEILVDSDGNIFSAQYDSFCYDDNDCPDAKLNPDGTYTVIYTKVPYGEQHTITLSDESQYSKITHGQGHAHGMSQLLSYQMAKEGKGYREILSYFYSDGVEISLVLSPTTTDGGEIITRQITNYLDVDQFNQTIFNQVIKSGLSTREGVVAAGTTLISNFYSQTGYKLPYELNPSGKYSGYGVDSSWGTNTGNSTYPVNGLDCSGFISWAIHNGGFSYEVKSAQGWGNAGVKRSWSKGTVDNTAKAGDLIFNAPASANGTTGHIRMIIGVTDEGYVVAEASSRKNGMRITNVSFKSTGSYYLVDMSNYYANATKVTDYPM